MNFAELALLFSSETQTIGLPLLSSFSYASKNLSTSGADPDLGQDNTPQGVAFDVSGTRLYYLGSSSDSVYQFNISTGEVDSASFVGRFAVGTEESSPQGLAVGSNGTRFYVVGGLQTIYQYNMTNWAVTTASYSTKSLSVSGTEIAPQGLHISGDGSKLFMAGSSGDRIYRYDMTTPFEIDTASFHSQSPSLNAQDSAPQGCVISSTGLRMFVLGDGGNQILEYSMSAPFDVTTLTDTTRRLALPLSETSPQGIAMHPSQNRIFVSGAGNRAIFQFNAS